MNKKVVLGIVFGVGELLYYFALGKICYTAGYDKGYNTGYNIGFDVGKHDEKYFGEIRRNLKETEFD